MFDPEAPLEPTTPHEMAVDAFMDRALDESILVFRAYVSLRLLKACISDPDANLMADMENFITIDGISLDDLRGYVQDIIDEVMRHSC